MTELPLVVDIVSGHTVRVHEIGAALTGAGAALRYVWVVLRAPVVAELVRRHQVGLPSDHPLPVVVSAISTVNKQVVIYNLLTCWS